MKSTLFFFLFLLSSCSSFPAAQVKAINKHKADQEECIKKHLQDSKKAHKDCMKEKGYHIEEEKEQKQNQEQEK